MKNKLSTFVMAYPFLKNLSARLKCLMTYAVGQLCINIYAGYLKKLLRFMKFVRFHFMKPSKQ